jgi:Flp pilus assembly protein TadD
MTVLRRSLFTAVLVIVLGSSVLAGLSRSAFARDLRITIPKRSRPTPVQQLNRAGVEAVNKHQLDKARELFYKAYLYDPGDPFTLNNLGYVAELEGHADRAQSFYSLASAQATEARIDLTSDRNLKGEALNSAVNSVGDVALQVNRANVQAVRLLAQGRLREANAQLQYALKLDPKNPFTLNNMGVVEEGEGAYREALNDYTTVANSAADEKVVVTMNEAWRGKSVSDMARASANRLRARMSTLESVDAQVAVLNLRGVSALNHGDWREARQDFSQAYRLAPDNAFSLNNQGYIAEMDGDLETAQEFYHEADNGGGAGLKVGVASRPAAEGMRLSAVADGNQGQVNGAIDTLRASRRGNAASVQLKRRDGTAIDTSSPPPTPQQ